MNAMTESPASRDTARLRPARVLLCAATRWEADPLAKRLGLNAETEGLSLGRAGKTPVELLKTGMGADNAARALAALPASRNFSCVLSVGLAGSLQAQAQPGDLVADFSEGNDSLKEAVRAAAQKAGAVLRFGAIADSPASVLAPAAKKALGEKTGAMAVDMETAAVRRWAKARGLSAPALRVILDGMDDEIPMETPAGEDAASLIKFAAAHAGELGRLWSIGRRQRRGMAVLAQVLEEFLPCL
ncbi:MAG: hypothetical protein KGI84_07995 [Elusimicrobia bacterium]|nr:hypothetical protein [Elusimicrobiota bacterium]